MSFFKGLFAQTIDAVGEVRSAFVAPQSTQELVAEIHDTFYTEVDRLLAQAMQANSLESDMEELVEKSKRLERLGFLSTKEVEEGRTERNRLGALEDENIEKQRIVAAINYFSQKYPQYKFITEESVKRICEKYGLIYGDVGLYIGTVPNKNLEQMEKFKIDKDDVAFLKREQSVNDWRATVSYCSSKEKVEDSHSRYYYSSIDKVSLQIAAPAKDFNMKNMEVKGVKLSKKEVPDPVVLQPVWYNGMAAFLIVTAWGPEASDELVVNQKMN